MAYLLPQLETFMKLLSELLTTDVGLMSFAVIVITLGMGAFYGRYFARHIAEDAARAGKQSQ
jgi:hypothetical protein